MSNYYFEINDLVVTEFGGKYFVAHHKSGDGISAGGYRITAASDRVWKERDDGDVRYLKNRTIPNDAPVDMKEFMWIKLQSHQLA